VLDSPSPSEPAGRPVLTCAECGREPRNDENAAEEWRAYLDIDDDLPVFCPECAEREFDRGSLPGGS
jgi:hypothetical protein